MPAKRKFEARLAPPDGLVLIESFPRRQGRYREEDRVYVSFEELRKIVKKYAKELEATDAKTERP